MGKDKNVRNVQKRPSVAFGFTFLMVFLAIFIIYSFFNSLFFNKKDRVNVILHSNDRIAYYSISTVDETNYLIYFLPDSKILVPGGYKYYRFGALVKIASIEKKPDILQRAFSSATSSFTDFYFTPSDPEILYGSAYPQDVQLPTFSELFFDRSNANLLDRVYLTLKFISVGKGQFSLISTPRQEEDFAKSYQGFFYNKAYRTERKLVQIIYTKKYSTANLISRILGGNGIQVVDISYDNKPHNTCLLIENTDRFSTTTHDLARFFNCKTQKGNTGTFDILFILGDKEDYWEA